MLEYNQYVMVHTLYTCYKCENGYERIIIDIKKFKNMKNIPVAYRDPNRVIASKLADDDYMHTDIKSGNIIEKKGVGICLNCSEIKHSELGVINSREKSTTKFREESKKSLEKRV